MEQENLRIAANTGYKAHKVSRISRNAYLNFLREYKKHFVGLSPQDLVRYAAKEWNKLKPEEKIGYRKRNFIKFPPRLQYFMKIEAMKKRLDRKYSKPLACYTPRAMGSAIAFIHFLRQFEKISRPMAAKAFRQRATHEWSMMTEGERKQFEEPFWYLHNG